MKSATPHEILHTGCGILDLVMKPHGFSFVAGMAGRGSGGNFASGVYVCGERRLELHFRGSLGLVTYHWGDASVSHQFYMQMLLGKIGGNQYPGFSTDPLDGFRHLAYDLQRFADDFLKGDGEVLRRAAAKEQDERLLQDRISMAKAVGDTRKRTAVRALFRGQRFREVVEILESLQYPDLMTESERKILEISRRRTR
ncbi:MAG TPA: hypothetical protein VFZ34_15465 [Blastocatellia bacterium]|nr:hypothetical protein [Blastocatellia bacterium]